MFAFINVINRVHGGGRVAGVRKRVITAEERERELLQIFYTSLHLELPRIFYCYWGNTLQIYSSTLSCPNPLSLGCIIVWWDEGGGRKEGGRKAAVWILLVWWQRCQFRPLSEVKVLQLIPIAPRSSISTITRRVYTHSHSLRTHKPHQQTEESQDIYFHKKTHRMDVCI